MKNNKIMSLALSAVIALSLLPPCAVYADEAVAISTVGDFKEFTEKCVYDEYSKNKRFVLQNDIDLKDEEIQCAEIFCGIFEGGGHSITNVKLSFEGSSKGLFAEVSKDGEIHDLNVTGEIRVTDKADDSTESVLRRRASSILSRVTSQSEEIEDSAEAAGGIVGYNEGKIVNCSFGGKITGKRKVGGIVGTNAMTGIVDSCVSGASVNAEKEAGGIAGYNEGRVKLSKNTGKICPDANEKTSCAGGICGNSEGAVVACTNDGEVGGESFGDNVGGICGKQSGELRECVNYGYVQGRRSVGGVCGRFEPYTDIELSYEAARDAIDNQIDTFKDDVDKAREKIIDYVDELLDGRGLISDILDRLGIKEGSTGDRLDRITNSATRMMDSITGTSDKLSDSGLSDTLRDTLNSVSDFSDEATESLKDTRDDLDTSLDNLNEFLDEFDGKGREITDTLDNLNEAINNGSEDVDEIKDKLFGELDDLEENIDKVTDDLDSVTHSIQSSMRQVGNAGGEVVDFFDDLDDVVKKTETELNRIKTDINKIREQVQERVDRINNFKNKVDNLIHPTSDPGTVTDEVQTYSVDPDAELENGYEVEPAVIGRLFTTVYAEEEKKTAISDLKSTDIVLPRRIGGDNADTALIKYCINNANVKGHEMTGGVIGSVGFESVVRSGENMTLPDGTKVNADSVLKAVTDGCVNGGDVESKSDYAGGIAGKCDIGDIKNSLSTGEIEIEDGSYAGGIAGYSSGDIKSCIAINDLDGESYIGGIAGSAKNIDTSYSLARLDDRKDKTGAVAGFVSGTVDGTYFIDEGLSGINGTNLEGKAEAVAPNDIAVSDGNIPAKMPLLNNGDFYMASGDLFMPQIMSLARNDAEEIGALLMSKSSELARFHFNVVFIDKEKELRTMVVDYGTVLDDADIPKLSADGREVPAWDKDVHAPIVRHTKFMTEYSEATTTLSSGEEPPILLVESVFADGTEVTLKSATVTHDFYGLEKRDAYSFSLNKKAYDVIKVHIRDEGKKAAKIAVEENGKWTLLDCEIDGSYAVFTVGAPCTFVVLYKKTSPLVIILICAGVLLVAACGFVVFRRIRHGKKEKSL